MIVDQLVTVLGLEIKDDGLPAFRSSLTSTIGKFGAIVAGAISASAAISAFLSAASNTNASVKFARSIDIGFEALQRLEFAAKRMGIEAGTLDGALSGLRSQARGAFFGKNDGAADTFGEIGVSVRDLNGDLKGSEKLLLDLADAVTNAANPDRILNLIESLGLGPQFEQLLLLGSSGIRALGDEAARSGAILSQDAAAAAERYADRMASLSAVIDTFLVEQGTPLLEWADVAAQAFLDYSRSPAFDELKTQLGDVSTKIGEIIGLNKQLVESFDFELPDGSGFAALVTGLALLARAHPVTAGIAAAAVVGADVQKFRNGEEGTKTEFLIGTKPEDLGETRRKLINFSEALGSFLDFLPGSGIQLPVGPPLSDSSPGLGAGPGTTSITVNNEVNAQGISDTRELINLQEGITGDTIREALEDARSRVVR